MRELPVPGVICILRKIVSLRVFVKKISQIFVHWRGIHDFTLVEHAVRVPGFLDLTHKFINLRAVHKRNKLSPEPAVAVLAGEASLVLADKFCCLYGNLAEFLAVRRVFEVENRPKMKFACAVQ